MGCVTIFFFSFLSSFAFASWDTVLEQAAPPPPTEVRAYSEWMPAPKWSANAVREGVDFFREGSGDIFWVSEREEKEKLRPGLELVGRHLLTDLAQLQAGAPPGGSRLKGIPAALREENPYWPESFPSPESPLVAIQFLKLSRTQNDQGQTPWTVYGGVEDNELLFWRSAPKNTSELVAWVCGLVGQKDCRPTLFTARPQLVPLALRSLVGEPTRVVLTFTPFAEWPAKMREAYLANELLVVPSPVTQIFQGSRLARELREGKGVMAPSSFREDATSLALGQELSRFARLEDLPVRLLRHGVLREAQMDHLEQEDFKRAHRFDRHPHDVVFADSEPKFSTFAQIFEAIPRMMGLYGKPLGRNIQAWSVRGENPGQWWFHGPDAQGVPTMATASGRVREAMEKSVLHFREYFPPMQVNGFEVTWYRPLVVSMDPKGQKFSFDPSLLGEIELKRDRAKLRFIPKLREAQSASSRLPAIRPVTFSQTVNEAFEKSYWSHLADLTEGPFVHKNSADCAASDRARHDAPDPDCQNDLPDLGEKYLRAYYRSLGLEVHTHAFEWVTDFKFSWWDGWKKAQGLGSKELPRNLIIEIPGKSRDEVVILADHYDTAYMEDIYDGRAAKEKGDRKAAKGADDNHSGTATLMRAAPVFQKLAAQGKLERTVWLVHLTGEEFPADCLGARALVRDFKTGKEILKGRKNPLIASALVLDMIAHNTDRDQFLKAGRPGEDAPHLFQISAGRGKLSTKTSLVTAAVTRSWNEHREAWNRDRKVVFDRIAIPAGTPRREIPFPPTTAHPKMDGELRPVGHPKSSLFNTDGQIFSDAELPIVLLMENYDIDREGYHDTKDDLSNIDLGYGTALARIAIETVAQLSIGE